MTSPPYCLILAIPDGSGTCLGFGLLSLFLGSRAMGLHLFGTRLLAIVFIACVNVTFCVGGMLWVYACKQPYKAHGAASRILDWLVHARTASIQTLCWFVLINGLSIGSWTLLLYQYRDYLYDLLVADQCFIAWDQLLFGRLSTLWTNRQFRAAKMHPTSINFNWFCFPRIHFAREPDPMSPLTLSHLR
jgi:hypothetical protein